MTNLTNKVAVVTGASKGIGAAIARTLAAAGASVVVNYASNREAAERVVAEIENRGGKAVAAQADVARAEDVKRLFKETRATFGPVDILVNNAGFSGLRRLKKSPKRHFIAISIPMFSVPF